MRVESVSNPLDAAWLSRLKEDATALHSVYIYLVKLRSGTTLDDAVESGGVSFLGDGSFYLECCPVSRVVWCLRC